MTDFTYSTDEIESSESSELHLNLEVLLDTKDLWEVFDHHSLDACVSPTLFSCEEENHATESGLVIITGTIDDDPYTEGNLTIWDPEAYINDGFLIVKGFEGSSGSGAEIHATFDSSKRLMSVRIYNSKGDYTKLLQEYSNIKLLDIYVEPTCDQAKEDILEVFGDAFQE